MARRALELGEAAALVTAAVQGTAGAPRQVVAAAVSAAIRAAGDLLLREPTCGKSEDEASEEVEARVRAIAPMLEKQVRGLPVCGNTRLARNVASHVGFGNGAQALRGSVQELKRQQRGARRGGKEKPDDSGAADVVDRLDYVKAKIQEDDPREEVPIAEQVKEKGYPDRGREERSKELREARAELAQLRAKSAEELAAARADDEERRKELHEIQAKFSEELAAARADEEERSKELNKARAELAHLQAESAQELAVRNRDAWRRELNKLNPG